MATTKKPPTTKSTRKSAKHAPMRSFELAKSSTPFFTFRITHQTFYWVILCGLVLALGVWVIVLNNRVQDLYDQIEANNAATESMSTPKGQ
jgi:hypothetical protein